MSKNLGEGYLTVEKLEQLLRDAPKDSYIVIGGALVTSVTQIKGNIEEGYYQPIFTRGNIGKKKVNGVVFTRLGELSNDDVVEQEI